MYLKGKTGLCSEAQPDQFSEGTTITVAPKRPASVKFVIVPLEINEIPIEIVAVDETGGYQDGILKLLNVRVSCYFVSVLYNCSWKEKF